MPGQARAQLGLRADRDREGFAGWPREHDGGHKPRAPLMLSEGDLQRCAVEEDGDAVANLNGREVYRART